MKLKLLFTVGVIIVSACTDKTSEQLPEVNEENCKHENIAKMKVDETQRQAFASQCLRRGSLNQQDAPSKSWGAGDL